MSRNRVTLWVGFGAAIACTSLSHGQIASAAALTSTGITQATYQKMYAANAAWKKREAFGLEATLSIANGKPTLIFEAEKNTSTEEVARRVLALISGLEFLLASDGFDRIRIVITEFTPGRRQDRTVRDFEITRTQFQNAVKVIAKTATAEDGIKAARSDWSVREQIGSQLGIK